MCMFFLHANRFTLKFATFGSGHTISKTIIYIRCQFCRLCVMFLHRTKLGGRFDVRFTCSSVCGLKQPSTPVKFKIDTQKRHCFAAHGQGKLRLTQLFPI